MKKYLLPSFLAILAMVACTNDSEEPDPGTLCNDGPQLSLVSQTNTSCGLAVGSIVVNATGGSGTLSFSIDGLNFQTSGEFNNLAANNYSVMVKDGNNCTDEISVVVGNDNGVNFNINSTDAGCKTSNGTITISASGGPRPYSYKLDAGGTYQSDSVFTNLAAGDYEIFVKDANDCESNQSTTLGTGIQFSAVKSLVQTNCAISGCYAGTVSPNLSTDAGIQNNAGRVKARTSAGTMPPPSSGKSLSTQEKERIACWVDDGATL